MTLTWLIQFSPNRKKEPSWKVLPATLALQQQPKLQKCFIYAIFYQEDVQKKALKESWKKSKKRKNWGWCQKKNWRKKNLGWV